MSNLFQKLELEAFRKGITPRTRESREWFRKKVQQLTRVNRSQLIRNPEVKETNTQRYGSMIMFTYDPKLKDARIDRLNKYTKYRHYRVDLSDKKNLENNPLFNNSNIIPKFCFNCFND